MFHWLRRHPECGNPCHHCEAVCPVGAIKQSGEINMNECFYCLDCQVAYYDDQICPPMVWRRKRQQSAIKPALASAADRALIERGAQ
jgi:polyferredoxin